jgi:hypothetical protein
MVPIVLLYGAVSAAFFGPASGVWRRRVGKSGSGSTSLILRHPSKVFLSQHSQ